FHYSHLITLPTPPHSTLFPYTTLFRSRTFTITGKEGRVGNNDSSIVLDGDVRLEGSDGMTAATEHATYADADGTVHAPGPVQFRSEEHTSELQSPYDLVCRLLLEKKKK